MYLCIIPMHSAILPEFLASGPGAPGPDKRMLQGILRTVAPESPLAPGAARFSAICHPTSGKTRTLEAS